MSTIKLLTTKLKHTFSKSEWHGARSLAIIYWGLKIQESKSRVELDHNRAERFRTMYEGIKGILVREIGKEKTERILGRYKI